MEKYWSEDLIKKIHEIAIAKAKEIAGRREEILEAFVAKYGYQPDEMVICEQSSENKFWVEHRPSWIKCEDRMPEKKGYYLCTYIFDNHRFYYDRWFDGVKFTTVDRITHWMPLPEKPKVEA